MGTKRKRQAVEGDDTRRLTEDETRALKIMKGDLGLSWERLADKANLYYPVKYTGEGLRKASFGFWVLLVCFFFGFAFCLVFFLGLTEAVLHLSSKKKPKKRGPKPKITPHERKMFRQKRRRQIESGQAAGLVCVFFVFCSVCLCF